MGSACCNVVSSFIEADASAMLENIHSFICLFRKNSCVGDKSAVLLLGARRQVGKHCLHELQFVQERSLGSKVAEDMTLFAHIEIA